MKVVKHSEFAALKARIEAAPKNCQVLVGTDYAHLFKSPPKDGRTYIVEDPERKGVTHWTYPDGSYVCVDLNRNPLTKFFEIRERRIYGVPHRKKKPARLASDLANGVSVRGDADPIPAMALIDIKRVMRISGFKKSFIYEQPNFPQPVKLGDSRRAPVRWVESEVLAWVQELVAKRYQARP